MYSPPSSKPDLQACCFAHFGAHYRNVCIAPRLKPDTGSRYVDQNTDRYPWSPLEPLIRAVLELQPKFDLGMMDIVTDRRPFRRLFAFVSGDGEDFEFGVESIGTTLLFARMKSRRVM